MDGWKLRFDTDQNGHGVSPPWFEPSLDERPWVDVKIGVYWDDFGYTHQTGLGWYRCHFDLPAKPACQAVELRFGAVDESAWIWINGQYAGQHDIGTAGWDQPFRLDVTPLVNWGTKNQITVRVLNRAMAGGIWKPVWLDIIQLQ